MTPTARTLKWLRDAGYVCEVVEKWNPHSKTRHDLFGMFDVLAMANLGGPTQLVGIQCCAGASHANRVAKLRNSLNMPLWKQTDCAAWVVSWRKAGPRGKRKTWQPRCEAL